MKPALTLALLLAATTVLAACGPADNDPAPGGVTVGEAKALDQAAEMIEGQKLPDVPGGASGAPVAAKP